MAQLAVAFVGAAIGGATLGTAPVLFGMTGSAIGFAAGSIIGGALFQPRMHGPRVEDLKVQISSYGAPLSKTYGTDRVAGVLIWAADFVESAHKQGGKGGPKVTTYSYTCSFAVAIGEGQVGVEVDGVDVRALRRVAVRVRLEARPHRTQLHQRVFLAGRR